MPSSPYSTKFASGDIDKNYDPKGQMKKFKREEKETHYAPNILPYELGNVPELYANMIENGMQAAKAIEVALKSKEYHDKDDLARLMKNTEKIIAYLIKTVDPTLEKHTIGARHAGDPDEKYEEMD